MVNKINLQISILKNQISNFQKLINEKKTDKENEELKKVSLEFEAIFIKQMLDSMKSSLNKKNNLLNGGQVEEIFEDMLYEQRSNQIAKSKSFGLADLLYNQLQEIHNLKK